MGPVIIATTILAILAAGVTIALVAFLAADPPARAFVELHARISRAVRRSCLMPLGFVAFAIVGGGQLQGQVPTIPSTTISQDFPRSGGMSEDMVTRIVTQGGAVAVLLVVLWSYRRDFMRKDEDKEQKLRDAARREEKLVEVLDRSTTAIANSVNATANQTRATHRLATTVETIERKMQERRQADDSE